MDKSMKIIAGVLLIVSIGYFSYTSSLEEEDGGEEASQIAREKTEQFIERRAILEGVRLNTDLFNDPVFRSYRSFTGEPVEFNFGRENPFRQIFVNEEEDES